MNIVGDMAQDPAKRVLAEDCEQLRRSERRELRVLLQGAAILLFIILMSLLRS